MEGDLDTLEIEQYVNDNIINFYLRYLVESLKLGEAVHVFNSFFYISLVGTRTKTINYERVQSWTRKVDIFEKESLQITIIQNAYWRLAILSGYLRLRTLASPILFASTPTSRASTLMWRGLCLST
jgi:Ulp1 family protease